jgi:hypothetical protein
MSKHAESKTVQLEVRTIPPKKLLPAQQPTIFRLFHQPHLFVEREPIAYPIQLAARNVSILEQTGLFLGW